MTRSQFILPLLFAASLLPALEAQTPIETLSPTSSRASTGDWMQTAQFFDNWHGRLYVVTLDHPGHRFNCKLQSIGAASLTCASSGLHAAHTFARDNIAALISPGHRDNLWAPFLILNGLAAGIIIAGCLIASGPGSIVLFVLGSLIALSFGAAAIGSGNFDTSDTILYQRPNTPLTVHLN